MTTNPSAIECVTYTDATPRLVVLNDAALARIHEAALDVLATTGVRVPLTRARAIFAGAGAPVDEAAERVRLPAALVENALKQATTRYALCARDSTQNLVIDGTRGYLSNDGSPAAIIDWDTRQPRPSTLADLERIVALADALPAIGFLWQSVSAGDVPPAERPLRVAGVPAGQHQARAGHDHRHRPRGPGGDYLVDEHTLRHMRGVWQPRAYRRDLTPLPKGERGRGEGSVAAAEAQEFIRDRLAHIAPRAPDPALRAELEAIISAAAGRL